MRLSDLLNGEPIPEPEPAPEPDDPPPAEPGPPPIPRSRVAVVERAARRIRAFEARRGGEEFGERSADDVLSETLGSARRWSDLMRWARLARAALRRVTDRRR